MKWYFYLIIAIIVSVLLMFYVMSFIAYKKLIKRGVEVPLNKVDLTNTQYKPYISKLYKDMEEMEKKPYQEISIKSFDGLKLVANYYDNNSNKLALLVHGYRATPLNNFSTIGLELEKRGYNLLMPYLRAHGKSEGKYITFGEKEAKDILEWIEYVDRIDSIDEIIIYGVSMGAAALIRATKQLTSKKIKLIVYDSGFTKTYNLVAFSLKRMCKAFVVLAPFVCVHAKLLAHFNINNKENGKCLADSNYKSVFVHGLADKLIPSIDTKKAFEIKKDNKDLILLDDAGHNMCFLFHSDEIINKMFE